MTENVSVNSIYRWNAGSKHMVDIPNLKDPFIQDNPRELLHRVSIYKPDRGQWADKVLRWGLGWAELVSGVFFAVHVFDKIHV